MVRFKVRSKKPNDTIRQKTPIQEKVPSIVGKTPTSSKNQFELPPSRRNVQIFSLPYSTAK